MDPTSPVERRAGDFGVALRARPDDRFLNRSLSSLAKAHEAAGRGAEAVALYEAMLQVQESRLGIAHRDTVATRKNLTKASLDFGIACADRDDWPGARAAFALAVRCAPRDVPLLREIGEAQARHERWVDAATTYGRVQELGSADHWDAYRYAVLLLKTGNLDAYRRHRRRMLDDFQQIKDTAVSRRLSKACLIPPLPGPDQDEARARALVSADDSISRREQLPYAYLNKSLSEIVPAILTRRLPGPTGASGRKGPPRGLAALPAHLDSIDVPCSHRSSRGIAPGVGAVQDLHRTRVPKPGSSEFGRSWVDRILCDCLLSEAEPELLHDAFPADPFAPAIPTGSNR